MFDKKKFSEILKNIVNQYASITDFSIASGVGRSYISKYIHQKMPTLPSPKVLKKISNASKGVTTYEELMEVCGYIDIYENHITKIYNELCHIHFSSNTFDCFIKYAYSLYVKKVDDKSILDNLSRSNLNNINQALQILDKEYRYKNNSDNNSDNIKLWMANIIVNIKQNKDNILNCYDGNMIISNKLNLSELTDEEIEEVKKFIDYLISKRNK